MSQSSRQRSTFALIAALVAACIGCEMSRFPTCKDDAECAAKGDGKTAPLCYDLRCVACRSDEDCGAGKTCNGAKECKSLGDDVAPHETAQPAATAAPDAGAK